MSFYLISKAVCYSMSKQVLVSKTKKHRISLSLSQIYFTSLCSLRVEPHTDYSETTDATEYNKRKQSRGLNTWARLFKTNDVVS